MGCHATDRDAVSDVLTAQADAWNRGDIDAFMDGYWKSDETIFASGDTVVRGWTATRDRYRQKYDSREKMGTLTFGDLNVRQTAPDMASVTGRWKLRRAADEPGGTFILVFRKFPDGWKIIYDNTSSDP